MCGGCYKGFCNDRTEALKLKRITKYEGGVKNDQKLREMMKLRITHNFKKASLSGERGKKYPKLLDITASQVLSTEFCIESQFAFYLIL